MGRKNDLVAEFPGLTIIHQKIPGHEVGRHEHREHEFFLPLQGEITVRSSDTEVAAGPGRMLYVPPDLDHSFSSSARGAGERLIWLIEDRLWGGHASGSFSPKVIPANALAKELLFHLLVNRQVAGAKYFIDALVAALADALAASGQGGRGKSSDHLAAAVKDARIARSMDVIEARLESCRIPEVARESGLSLRNFNRLFLKEVGMGPKEYLTLRRIERAKVLLASGPTTVTDISLEVGYGSLSKFISAFKKVEGILPSDYREKSGG